MYENDIGYAMPGYAPGHNPEYQRRLNLFNFARGLFPYTSGVEGAKAIKASDVIKAAREIEAYLNGENA